MCEKEIIECALQKILDDYGWSYRCEFKNVTITKESELTIVTKNIEGVPDNEITKLDFSYSKVFLLHPDILAKFPNTSRILTAFWERSQLINQHSIENCKNMKQMILYLDSFKNISSTTFLECSNLEELRIGTNSITDFPDDLFLNQRKLKRLELMEKGFNFRNKPFSRLPNLESLSLERMTINSVETGFFQSFKKLQKFTFVDYTNALYRTFPMETLKDQQTIEHLEITFARLGNNQELLFKTLITMGNLKKLRICLNLIQSLDFFVCNPQLKFFEICFNSIKVIPPNAFKNCPDLEELFLYDNPISALNGEEFNHLHKLKEIRLQNTRISSIEPRTFNQLVSLKQLSMGNSFTSQLTVIGKLFEKNTNLWHIGLHSNGITEIHPEAFDNMSNITASIDLNKNVCVDKSFYVYYGDFSQMKQELATCFNNYLKKEILCDFKQSGSNYICYIRNVLVEKSETTEISGSHLPGKTDNDVSTVIFINSTLKEIPQKIFLKFQKLQTLNVESTGLAEIKQLESCNNLETFIASYNQISALETKPFENCINLKFLDLHYNKIQKLRGNVFESNTKLEEIDFSRNEINDIEPCGFLRNQPEFRSINLYENQCVHANIRVWNGDFSEMERLLNPCFISWYSNLYN